MLPNEVLDKIFKYRYQNFRNFLSKMRKINREYGNKYKAIGDKIFFFLEYNNISEPFYYNYRKCGPNCSICQVISNPKSIGIVAYLSKNHYY